MTDGRAVELGPAAESDRAGLIELYVDYPTGQRSMGIPPLGAEAVTSFVDRLLATGRNAVARGEGHVVGHATLVPATDAVPELAVFVDPAWQSCGVGTRLCLTLVERARRRTTTGSNSGSETPTGGRFTSTGNAVSSSSTTPIRSSG